MRRKAVTLCVVVPSSFEVVTFLKTLPTVTAKRRVVGIETATARPSGSKFGDKEWTCALADVVRWLPCWVFSQ